MDQDQKTLEAALQRCAAEPIHLAGAIQPYGVLLGLDDTMVVRMASANAGRMFGLSIHAMLDVPLAELIGAGQVAQLKSLPLGGEQRHSVLTVLDIPLHGTLRRIAAQAHHSDQLLILEFEPALAEGEHYFGDLFTSIRDALWHFDAATDVREYAHFIAAQMQQLTGFDRVMVYQFDHRWDGEVIAEARNDTLPSLLGNHFPATDIPPQARALYTKNLIRVLIDTDAVPEPLLPTVNPLTQRPLDMSFSVLRAMSPIHLDYMRNMGTRASITLSLIQGGRLWGMIACHNATPRSVPFQLRELCEFVGKTVSMQLGNIESAVRSDYMNQVRETLMLLTGMLRENTDLGYIIKLMESEILGLVRATGAVICIGNRRYFAGATPAEDETSALAVWVKGRMQGQKVFFTESLGPEFAAARSYADVAAGLLAVALDDIFDNYILWFRREVVQDIPWAGNPEKALVVDAAGARIEPRHSFEVWRQTARGRSLPWSGIETDAAHSLSQTLVEVLTHKALRITEQNYRLLAELSSDVISRHDAQGRFLFVSPASFEMFGIKPENLVGRFLPELCHPEDQASVTASLAKVAQEKLPDTVLYRYIGPTTRMIWIESTIKHVGQSERGRPGELVVNSRDVTERQEYQQAIDEIQKRNSAILESAGEGVLGIDREGRVTFANARAGEILGVEPAMMAGKNSHALFHATHPGQSIYPVEQCPIHHGLQERRVVQSSDDYFTRPDGSYFPVEYIGTPIITEGKVDGMVMVFRDITERRLIDDKLRQSDTVFENAAESIMMLDADGNITAVNRAFSEITGYAQEEVIGQKASILKSGHHAPEFYRGMWQQTRDTGFWRGEIWNKRKNGEIFLQWGSVTAVRDEKGKLRNYVAVFTDITQIKEAEEKLQFLASHDPLTGLPNRSLLNDRLQHAVLQASTNHNRLALAFIDFDHFKTINDTLGHSAGDIFLTQVAKRLATVVRREDTLARWGGDEFVIVLEQTGTAQQLAEWAERLLRTLAQPITLEGHDLVPSASMGLCLYPEDGDTPARLIQAADSAMYRAKHLGRNRFEFFTHQLTEDAERRFQMGWEIRRAIATDELLLYYQPQCAARDGHLVGFEALVRWRHPERGLIAPIEFLPLADELGLLADIGDWVLRAACQQVVAWGNALPAGVRVSVNVAPVQLSAPFVQKVQRILAETGAPVQRLELEITEGAMERREDARKVLEELRALGFTLSIDDFGTGYSSLAHLRHFPIDCLKIDKSFIDGLPGNDSDLAIVRTILALGTSLKLEVVAEGVETAAQRDLLVNLGVQTIQGYFFSRPLPAEAVLGFGR